MYCLLNYQLYGWLVNLDFEVHCHIDEKYCTLEPFVVEAKLHCKV